MALPPLMVNIEAQSKKKKTEKRKKQNRNKIVAENPLLRKNLKYEAIKKYKVVIDV